MSGVLTFLMYGDVTDPTTGRDAEHGTPRDQERRPVERRDTTNRAIRRNQAEAVK